jgi:lysophospholipase L1-like esterase
MVLIRIILSLWLCLGAAALTITALGSSFAAGFGLPRGQSYAQLLARKLSAKLEDLSVSGSLLLDVGRKIANIPPDGDIITITSGGNDLGYIVGLSMDRDALISEDEVTRRYSRVLELIHKQAPSSKIFVVEYLTILGPDARPGVNNKFNASRLDYHKNVAAMLQRATARASEGKAWVERIPVANMSDGHGIGSPDPWVNGRDARGEAPWHPRLSGNRAIAEMLAQRLGS